MYIHNKNAQGDSINKYDFSMIYLCIRHKCSLVLYLRLNNVSDVFPKIKIWIQIQK